MSDSDRHSGSNLVFKSDFENWIELTAPSRLEYVQRLEEFLERLAASKLSKDEISELKFIVNEICSNAIEWGNKKDVNRKVKVSYCLFEGEIVFKIEDEGEGFDTSHLADPTENPLERIMARSKEGKRLGGFGIHLVKKIMDDVIFNEKGNTVILSKYI